MSVPTPDPQRPDTKSVDPFRVAEAARQQVQKLSDRIVILEAQLAEWQLYANGLEQLRGGATEG